ncbi:PH domain-containing protein [Candidatus Uhrbacteria bacterium]|nr:PH domain-containing protein [Candidatus Uhrbacteria bacterium]
MISVEKIAQQKEYEKFVLLVRRHWIVLAGAIAMLVLEIFLPLAVISALESIIFIRSYPALDAALSLLLSLYSLFILLFFLVNVMNYYLDVWIISNERLVNIEQKGLFSRSVAELRFYRVQDVKSEVNGFLPTLFNYGTITVETAGAQENFVMQQIPHTQIVVKHLQELIEYDQQYHIEKKRKEGII